MMEFQWVIRSFAKNIGPGVADVDSSRPVIKISLDFGLQKREILDSTGRITNVIHISTQGQGRHDRPYRPGKTGRWDGFYAGPENDMQSSIARRNCLHR